MPTWNAAQGCVGLEHLRLGEADADSAVLAIDDAQGRWHHGDGSPIDALAG